MLADAKTTLLSHKAIALCPDLTGADKAIASCVLEHYNRETGRCYPSITRIAAITGLNKTTVKKSIKKMKQKPLDLFTVILHGERFGTNRYIPNWEWFKCFNHQYDQKLHKQIGNLMEVKPPPRRMSKGNSDQGQMATQTYIKNLQKKPTTLTLENDGRYEPTKRSKHDLKARRISGNKSSTKNIITNLHKVNSTNRKGVALESAKKRIDQFMKNLGEDIYENYVVNVTEEHFESAIRKELKKPYAGCHHLLEVLKLKGRGG